MIDLKPQITAALRGDTAIDTLLGKDARGNVKIYPEVAPDDVTFPYITYFEIINSEATHADDEELESDIHFQIDVWSKGNTSPVAKEVAKVMKSLGFRRTSADDQFEKDTKTYHKILRFSGRFLNV